MPESSSDPPNENGALVGAASCEYKQNNVARFSIILGAHAIEISPAGGRQLCAIRAHCHR
jgi:hypothetical protein